MKGLALILVLSALILSAHAAYVWLEAETATTKSSGWPGSDPILSGGQWHWAPQGNPTTLGWNNVNFTSAGQWLIYSRQFTTISDVTWQMDGGVNTTLTTSHMASSSCDYAPQTGANEWYMNQACWYFVGAVNASAGTHSFNFWWAATGMTAFDVILFTNDPFFTPRANAKPDQYYSTAANAGFFNFDPLPDNFSASPIDLRTILNEPYAGAGGYIQSSGNKFVHADTGAPARFWAVNLNPGWWRMDKFSWTLCAKFLAKHGINQVRFLGMFVGGSGAGWNQIDQVALDGLFQAFAILKSEGIYTHLATYYYAMLSLDGTSAPITGYPTNNGNKAPTALVYFSQQMQQQYLTWFQLLLNTTNPYTGKTLAADPALSSLEMCNEDSTLFWADDPWNTGSGGNIPDPAQLPILQGQFYTWLITKYGNEANLTTTWGASTLSASQGDNFAAQKAGFRNGWNMFNNPTQRDKDQAEFLAVTLKNFYSMVDTAWASYGFKGTTSGSGWQTVSTQFIDPLDHWANLGADHHDRHQYYGCYHTGNLASWTVFPGDKYRDCSTMQFKPAGDSTGPDNTGKMNFYVPVFEQTWSDHPSTISELSWENPSKFRGEAPFLMSVYGAQSGIDSIMWFVGSTNTWDTYFQKWPVMTPSMMGQFPALALIFRQQLIPEAKPVANIQLSYSEMMNIKGVPAGTAQDYAALRTAGVLAGGNITSQVGWTMDPLMSLVGKVNIQFSQNGGTSWQTELSPYVSYQAKMIGSANSVLWWNYDVGVLLVNAPKAQGLCGLLGNVGPIDLKFVTFDIKNTPATIMLVPLDNTPIGRSTKLLLQVFSNEVISGWTSTTDASTQVSTVTSVGRAPFQVEQFKGTVSFKASMGINNIKVQPLDLNGYPTGAPVSVTRGSFDLLPNTMYYYITK